MMKVRCFRAMSLGILFSGASALFPTTGHGETQKFMEVHLESASDDNLQLAQIDEDSVTTTSARARIGVVRATRTTVLSGSLSGLYTNYDDSNFRDTNSTELRLFGKKQTRKLDFGLSIEAREEPLLRSGQIAGLPIDDGLLDQPEADLERGLVEDSRDRNQYLGFPFASYALSRNTRLLFTGEYRKVTYDSTSQGTNLIDSRFYGGDVGLVWSASPRVDYSIGLIAKEFEPEFGAEQSITTAYLSWKYSLSDDSSIKVNIGTQRLDIDQSDESSNFYYSATFRTRWARGEGELRAARQALPTGFGSLVETEQVGAKVSYFLTRKWTLSSSIERTATDAPRVANFQDHDYTALEVSVVRSVGVRWELGIGYRFRYIDLKTINDSADSNRFLLRVSWLPFASKYK